jgi:nicotinic acid mononucleotide adenylyltransferase
MRLREIFEAPETTAVMAFGRMNPPTIGHAKLVDAVVSQGGDPYIFLSQSQKPKTDPLAFEDKLRYAKFFFPNVTIGNPEVKTIIQALQKVAALGYANLIYVAGSDRVASFEKLLNDYNGKEYNFNSIKVVSAGERDPDADGAEGMSASKMRAAAAEGDLESFKQGVPQQEVADEMYAAVRQGMGIKDAVPVQGVAEGWKQKAIQQAAIVYNINKAVKKHKEKEAEKRKSDEKQVKDQGMGIRDQLPVAAEDVTEHEGVKHRYQMTHPDGSTMKFDAKDDADAKRQGKAHGAKSVTKQQNKKKSS